MLPFFFLLVLLLGLGEEDDPSARSTWLLQLTEAGIRVPILAP